MTSVVFVTQLIDSDDPVLGFVIRQVEALAERGARIVVVANEVRRVPPGLDAEVISLGKERACGRGRRLLRYEMVIARLARELRPATLLAHMCPIYVTAAAPTIRARGGHSMLWFAHPADSVSLAVAERLSDVVLTTLPGSYPRHTRRLRVIGQAVDTDRFPFAAPAPIPGRCRLVALGRVAPVKGYDTILRGVAAARAVGVDATLDIIGPTRAGSDRQHRTDLLALRDRLQLGDAVAFEDGIAHDRVPERIRAADALVNATCRGSADKAVFEAMACGRPVLASNPALAELLGGTGLELSYPPDDDRALGTRIAALTSAPDGDVRAAAAELRSRIERGHSLDHWATSVLEIAGELERSGASPSSVR